MNCIIFLHTLSPFASIFFFYMGLFIKQYDFLCDLKKINLELRVVYGGQVCRSFYMYKGKVKSSWPSLRETRDKRPFGSDAERSWCHRHISVNNFLKSFFSRSPWFHGHRRQHSLYTSFTLVWRWHQLLSGSLPNGRLSQVPRRLSAWSRTSHFAIRTR